MTPCPAELVIVPVGALGTTKVNVFAVGVVATTQAPLGALVVAVVPIT